MKESKWIVGGLKRQPYLGCSIKKIQRENGEGGFEIVLIKSESPGQRGGLRVGDVVTEINGISVKGFNKISEVFRQKELEDESVLIRYYRNGESKDSTVTLEPKELEQSEDNRVIYDSIESQGRRLRVILSKPKAVKGINPPIILFIQGIVDQSIDFVHNPNHPYKKIIDGFMKRGFSTLRLERAGKGDSQGSPYREQSFYEEVDDYRAALDYIASLDEIDKREIYLFGYSLGGVIAPLIADRNIKGIIVFGTIASNYYDYILNTMERQNLRKGMREDDLKQYIQHAREVLGNIFDDRLAEDPYLFGKRDLFHRQLAQHNLLNYWRGISSHVLIVIGKEDYVADIKDHLNLYDQLKSKNEVEYVNLLQPNVDHNFIHVKTNLFADEVLNEIVDWCIKIKIHTSDMKEDKDEG